MFRALTIAGSDPSGGAGLQADLKTFQHHGVYGMSVVTLITVQNTLGVSAVHPLPTSLIEGQLDAVLTDVGVDGAKTGALGSVPIIEAVAGVLNTHPIQPLVVDPVMISKHGHPLLDEDAVTALRALIFPRATVLTPNLHEASALLGRSVTGDPEDMIDAARALHAMGPQAVFLKGGGHTGAEALDILFDGTDALRLTSPWVDTTRTHGTGCTFSAALTSWLSQGYVLHDAVSRAKAFIYHAIADAPSLGKGVGPVNHMVPID